MEYEQEWKKLGLSLHSLAIFRDVLKNETMQALLSFLAAESAPFCEQIAAYSRFVSKVYEKGGNWSAYLLNVVLENENPYLIAKTTKKPVDAYMEASLSRELGILQKASLFYPAAFLQESALELPGFTVEALDFAAAYDARLQEIFTRGYGIYARYRMFMVENGQIVPVRYPDGSRLSQLVGYERERGEVIANTLALLEGGPAQNALLVGDAGTGKSTTVKAIVNEYAAKGLRLIEVAKEQLRDLPHIMDQISRNPLKFIIFIDDLSFSTDDDTFGALKAMLEGSVSGKAENAVIYATSNRRHLIRESFSDREGDDIHRNDTMQQLLSLSARFGLKVTFSRPEKKDYIQIVHGLAAMEGLVMDEQTLTRRAEAFAIAGGSGRSPRTAKQFIQTMLIEQKGENDADT